jgi:hypothetical protein
MVFGFGHEAILFGASAAPLALDLDTNRLRALPAPPEAVNGLMAIASTGSQLLFWGESSHGTTADLRAGRLFTFGERFDVARERWSKMADVPDNAVGEDDDRSKVGSSEAVWTGSEMLLWTGDLHAGPESTVPILAYSPTHDRWRTLGTTNTPGLHPDGPAVWTGNEMILHFRNGLISVTPH